MIKVITLKIGDLGTNCYLTYCSETKECLIIDPADEANYIGEKILQQKLTPKTIIATHGHFDHTLAAGELQAAFGIPFLIHKKDEKILKQINKSASFWLKREIIALVPKVNGWLDQDSKIKLGQHFFEVAHFPGHTPGSICLYQQKNKIAFCGDIIFEQGIGRTDFSYSDQKQMKQSLENLQQQMAGFTLYPGHGDYFLL